MRNVSRVVRQQAARRLCPALRPRAQVPSSRPSCRPPPHPDVMLLRALIAPPSGAASFAPPCVMEPEAPRSSRPPPSTRPDPAQVAPRALTRPWVLCAALFALTAAAALLWSSGRPQVAAPCHRSALR
jgi:hypothetical protein